MPQPSTIKQPKQLKMLHLSDYFDGQKRDKFIAELGNSLHQTGFVTICDHQIEPELIRATYEQFKAFFELPLAQKTNYIRVGGARGFTALGREIAKRPEDADLKEYFHIGQEGNFKIPVMQNVFPTELPQLRLLATRLFSELERVANSLLEALAYHLQIEPGFFRQLTCQNPAQPWTILRAIHYPPLEPGFPAQLLRSAPHEDVNLITLLCGATAPGLEIQVDEDWLPVETRFDQLVVDSGGMLSYLTNGYFPATVHRVVNPERQENTARYSMPFFVYPSGGTSLQPLGATDESIRVEKFVLQQLQKTSVVVRGNATND